MTVAVERHHYVFLLPCGCPEGLLEATPRRPGGKPQVADEDAAWSEMYATRAEERAAHTRGIRVVHVDHGIYARDFYPLMTGRCPHGSAEGGETT